jgi:putative PIN family toxin of toxin-antitoxin system
MRVVLDANVLISAAISRGPSHRIVQAWLRHQPFDLVICDRLLGEVRNVLTERPHLRRWVSLETAELYVTTLEATADVVPDPSPGPALTRDPDDDYVVHLARAHDADLIVSGDSDLLEWHEQDPPVIPPAEFEGDCSGPEGRPIAPCGALGRP